MRHSWIVTTALGLSACALAHEDGDTEPQGAAAAPGNSLNEGDRTFVDLDRGAAAAVVRATDSTDVASRISRQPRGVVLEDGRVVTEEQARTGLVPKAGLFSSFRFIHSAGSGMEVFPTTAPNDTHVCVLALVWGTLYGNGVTLEKGVSNWTMYEDQSTFGSTNPRVGADAICYPLSAFVANNATRSVSDFFPLSFQGSGSRSLLTWWGDAATYLTRVAGVFSGTNERAWVTQSNTSNASSTLSLATQDGTGHSAWAYSVFVGVPGGVHHPQFIGPNGIGTAQVAGEYSYDYFGSDTFHMQDRRMAHSNEGMCYFTSISGKFRGGSEYVQIYLDASGFWTLSGNAFAGSSNHVHVKARCYRINQTGGQ